MDEYCSFKKCGCPVPPKSSFVCFKGDEKWCAISVALREKEEKKQDNQIIALGGVKYGKNGVK